MIQGHADESEAAVPSSLCCHPGLHPGTVCPQAILQQTGTHAHTHAHTHARARTLSFMIVLCENYCGLDMGFHTFWAKQAQKV